jgi:hypothetical protein
MIFTRVATLAGIVTVLGLGCVGGQEDVQDDFVCEGACDVFGGDGLPGYSPDFALINALWRGETPVQSLDELYRVTIRVGGMEIPADTHLFGPVNIIPFHNDDNVTDASGNPIARGDAHIARYFPPGEIGIGVMHHRPEHRVLDLSQAQASQMKEHFKFQDTHIEIVVGVVRDGEAGVITMNNPQTYQNGRFGAAGYVPFFLRPDYPEYLTPDLVRLFRDNIRTMVVGFNAVSNFPGDYNGGDPLAANSPERVVEHTAMMVRAITGDAEARAWFEDPAHQIYCAELAHVSFSAGLIVPLNASTMVPLVGQDVWDEFARLVAAHNAGESTPFTSMNDNRYASLVELALAPEDLEPASTYSGDPADAQRLAFQPMTMADIVEQFIRAHLPREQMGEQLAPVQGAVLQQMRPGLLETMGMDQLPDNDPRKVAVNALFDQIVQVVSTQYPSYQDFRTALAPLMDQARTMTGPRDETGTGLFVPPSTMHVIAQGHHPGGMLGLRYVGHALHFSLMRMVEAP